jgi:hypothetical protein
MTTLCGLRRWHWLGFEQSGSRTKRYTEELRLFQCHHLNSRTNPPLESVRTKQHGVFHYAFIQHINSLPALLCFGEYLKFNSHDTLLYIYPVCRIRDGDEVGGLRGVMECGFIGQPY